MSARQPELGEWLRNILDERQLSHRKFAEKAGVAKATITNIVGFTSTHEANPDTCRKIAKALNIPEEFVLEKAGWIKPPKKPVDIKAIEYIYNRLTEEGKNLLVQYAEFLRDRHSLKD